MELDLVVLYWHSFGAPLGSGQFGDVHQAELEMSGKKVEVAVKTPKEGTGEEERVKFLQEAAIMGQFNHFNVVTMYGVITEGEPVCSCAGCSLFRTQPRHFLY